MQHYLKLKRSLKAKYLHLIIWVWISLKQLIIREKIMLEESYRGKFILKKNLWRIGHIRVASLGYANHFLKQFFLYVLMKYSKKRKLSA